MSECEVCWCTGEVTCAPCASAEQLAQSQIKNRFLELKATLHERVAQQIQTKIAARNASSSQSQTSAKSSSGTPTLAKRSKDSVRRRVSLVPRVKGPRVPKPSCSPEVLARRVVKAIAAKFRQMAQELRAPPKVRARFPWV